KATFEKTDSVELCTIPLPVTQSSGVNRLMLGMKHVYLKVAGKTYGTPFTSKGAYLGGDAYLYTDDIFFKDQSLTQNVERCYPVKKKLHDTHEHFARRVECVAEKMAVSSDSLSLKEFKKWYPVFDYHFLNNNCA